MTSLSRLYQLISDNPRQKQAVDSPENTVVIAGPGSGKTLLAAVKAGKLLSEGNGVACISYSNATANKLRLELQNANVCDSQLFIGTLHQFCLRYVVHRYLHLIRSSLPVPWSNIPPEWGIASQIQSRRILQPLHAPAPERFLNTTLVRIRRCKVSQEDLRWARRRDLELADAYDRAMVEVGLLDFEMVIQLALEMIRSAEWIAAYLGLEFAWLIVDEYQDLGASLHTLVLHLIKSSNVKVLAVGDPDQIIFADAGSSQEYLFDLANNHGFNYVETDLCYRFGSRLISASLEALQASDTRKRQYRQASSVTTPGEIHFCYGHWDVNDLGNYLRDSLLPELIQKASDPSAIAVLYAQKGDIVDALRRSFTGRIEFTDERNAKWPTSPIVEWLRQCADWVVEGEAHVPVRFSELFEDGA